MSLSARAIGSAVTLGICLVVTTPTVFGDLKIDTDVPRTTPISDISLGEFGMLTGVLVNSEGEVLADAVVQIRRPGDDRTLVDLRTDKTGRFNVRDLRGGIHQISAGNQTWVVRLWTASTAPPSAVPNDIVMVADRVVRGQMFDSLDRALLGDFRGCFLDSVLIGAAGVAGGVIGFNAGLDRYPPASP